MILVPRHTLSCFFVGSTCSVRVVLIKDANDLFSYPTIARLYRTHYSRTQLLPDYTGHRLLPGYTGYRLLLGYTGHRLFP